MVKYTPFLRVLKTYVFLSLSSSATLAIEGVDGFNVALSRQLTV